MSRFAWICACLVVLSAGCADDGTEERSASVCFNPKVYEPGASIDSVFRPYRVDSGSGNDVVSGPDFVRAVSVSGPVSFQGTESLESAVASGYTFAVPRRSYFVLDGQVIVDYGAWADVGYPGNPVPTTVSYSPPRRAATTNFSLQAGERIDESFASSVDGGPPTDESSSQIFVGFEDVSTPAGVFAQACHFAFPSERDGMDTTAHVWIARGSGIEVKRASVVLVTYGGVPPVFEARDENQQLVLATLNGVLVSP